MHWINVNDRLPDDDLIVLVYSPEHEPIWLAWVDSDGWHLIDGGPCNPSHWMPLPEGPK